MVYRTTEHAHGPWNQFPSATNTKEVLERNRAMWLQQGRELVDKQPVLDSLLADARARLEAHGRFAFDVSTRFRFQSGNDNSPSEDARHTYMLKGITEELEARFRGKGYKTTTSSSTYITVELP